MKSQALSISSGKTGIKFNKQSEKFKTGARQISKPTPQKVHPRKIFVGNKWGRGRGARKKNLGVRSLSNLVIHTYVEF